MKFINYAVLSAAMTLQAADTHAGFFDELQKVKEQANEIKKAAGILDKKQNAPAEKKAPEKPPTQTSQQTQKTKSTSKTASAPKVANGKHGSKLHFISDSSNNRGFGQPRALNADGSRLNSQTPSEDILMARKQLARVYLHYFPDAATKDENTIKQYAGIFYPQEYYEFNRARLNAFEQKKKINEWEKRLKAIKTTAPGPITLYKPVAFSRNYDFDKQSFPININFDFMLPITTGISNWSCIELDKKFSLTQLRIPEAQAEKFMQANQSNRNGSSIFIGYTLQITGLPEVTANQKPRCTFEAKLQSVKGYEYKGQVQQNYADYSAEIGKNIRDWISNPNQEADIEVAYKYRQVADNAPAEAKQFNLLTREGLIQYPSSNGYYQMPNEAGKALRQYVDFLQLSINPAYFENQGLCYARHYLSKTEASQYLTSNGRNWKGDTPFEQEASKQAFLQGPAKTLMAQAVKTPQRYILITESTLDNYDKNYQGFSTRPFVPKLSFTEMQGSCSNLHIQATADFIEPFWDIAPAAADTLLNSLDKPGGHSYGGGEVLRRKIYIKSTVTLEALTAAKPQMRNENEIPQNPPLLMTIQSAGIYADEGLTRKVHELPLYHPPKPVLATGLPNKPKKMQTFVMDSRNTGYWALMAGKPLSERVTNDLLVDLMKSDAEFYAAITPYQNSQTKPTAPDIPAGYIPFYPKSYTTYMDYMSPEHKEMALAWLKGSLSRMPNSLTLKTMFRYDTRGKGKSLTLDLATASQLPESLTQAGLTAERAFYPPRKDNYGSYGAIDIDGKQYQLLFYTEKPVDSYTPKFEVTKVFNPDDGWNPYYGSLETNFDFTVRRVELIDGENGNGYVVAHIKPTAMTSYHYADQSVVYQQSY